MKAENQNKTTQEFATFANMEQKAAQVIRDIELQKNQAEQTAEDLERQELEALLLAAQREAAEQEAHEHEQAIERIGGE